MAMITKRTMAKITWIDLESPTAAEIDQVVGDYKIQPLVAHELMIPTIRPKVDLYSNVIYLILHFPAIVNRPGVDRIDQEIDFVIGKNFIITARYEPIDSIHTFTKTFEVNSILQKEPPGDHAGFLFFEMLSGIYNSLLHQLESIKTSINDIENQIFKGREKEMVFQISKVSRDLIDFRRATSLHKEVLESMEIATVKFFGEDFRFYIRSLIGDYYRVENAIKNDMEFMNELRDTNNALLSTKQNQVMQALTVIAFIALPLTVITSLFQIDTKARPIVGMANDFWIIAGILAAVGLALYLYFKKRGWL
jgi:magnesium transporter